ncbi:hypothetical protein KW805_02445 [Candidatus Pacearchaeota archaeon]|nr:hypothetical protein [Candidatus Pacearchaeota archaeon]
MSNSLLSNSRVFLLIVLLPLSSGLEFGVSPPVIHFEGTAGELLCTNVSVSADAYPLNLALSDRWGTIVGERSISRYSHASGEKGLDVFYPLSMTLIGPDSFPVCLRSSQAGTYAGLLIIDVVDSKVMVGSWIEASVSPEKTRSFLTGFGVEDSGGQRFLYWELGILVILACLFAILIVATRKRISKKVYILCFVV